MSELRTCFVLGTDRSSVRYRSRRPDDAEIRERLRELSRQRRCFGYRRCLNETLFSSLPHGRHVLAEWRDDSTMRGPIPACGLTPAEATALLAITARFGHQNL